MIIDPTTQQKAEQFYHQDLRTLKRKLSTMTVRDILFLEQSLMIIKDSSDNLKLQEHQYEIDEKLLELRKRKNKDYNPEKIADEIIKNINSKLSHFLNLQRHHK
jgi:hypothetical protein